MTQIATNIEQSKRLIEVGLDPKCADMCWRALAYEKDASGNWYPQKGTPTKLLVEKPTGLYVPAWSLSRLIVLSGGCNLGLVYEPKYVIEVLVARICFLITTGDIKEEYLAK